MEERSRWERRPVDDILAPLGAKGAPDGGNGPTGGPAHALSAKAAADAPASADGAPHEGAGEVHADSGAPSIDDFAELNRRRHELADKWGMPYIDLDDWAISEKLIHSVPAFLLKEHKVLPLKLVGRTLTVAMCDPLNVRAVDELRLVTGYEIEQMIAREDAIMAALDSYIGLGVAKGEVEGLVKTAAKEAEEIETEVDRTAEAETEDLRLGEEEPIIVRIVGLILAGGIKKGASDVHIQPEENALRVRYRVDGVLQDAPSHSWRYGRAVCARLKVMARLDIAEKRRPQDGRIALNCSGRRYDLRVSTFPSVYGEKIVLRIAEQTARHVGLHQLGFDEAQLKRFEHIISRPYGMLLVTGPTGSGKTTTLYCVLNRLNIPDRNIITVEDPVERRIPGVAQGHVGSTSRSPVTFATALRSILRQDPDVIMVGEIRDHETAVIATQASLTGHVVLSTLHTNDAPGALPRLLDMGVEPFLVSSSVIGVLAQRLVRTLCLKCREPYELPVETLRKFPCSVPTAADKVLAYKPRGCPTCNDQGYRGRIGIFELLTMTDEIRQLVLARAPAIEIARVAIQQGMVTLLQDAIHKVLAGVTSMQEALRVVDIA